MCDRLMEHYYTKEPTGEYREHNISPYVMGKRFEFITADGVFSKSGADIGTMTLLSALFSRHSKIGTLLDISCGYGIMGISAASIVGADVTMCDINRRAVMLAQKNAKKNDVVARVIESDGYDNIEGKYDIIITNPPIRAGKKVFYQWIENSKDYLNENGEFWLVAQKKHGAKSIKALMENTFGNCETVKKDNGIFVLMSKNTKD